MEKLELKYLAPYLPYGLMNQRSFHTPQKIDGIVGNKVYFGDTVLFMNQIEPILRPLSDLTKEIDPRSRNYFSYSTEGLMFKGKNECYTRLSDIEFLFENHFDVFGLIEKGLAIDINTLNK